jgi:hypothetical protein
LFTNSEHQEILFFGDAIYAEKLRNALPDIEIHHVLDVEEALTLLSEKDYSSGSRTPAYLTV